MNKTVFVSSTFTDLKDYRSELWSSLTQELKLTVKGMEEFGARKSSPLETCLEEVTQSDIFVCLIGFRFGSLHQEKSKSYTQLEYERAVELNKDILIYFLDTEKARVLEKDVDKDDNKIRLDSFKAVLRERHTIDSVSNPEDFSNKVKRQLQKLTGLENAESLAIELEGQQNINNLKKFCIVPSTVSGKEALVILKFFW